MSDRTSSNPLEKPIDEMTQEELLASLEADYEIQLRAELEDYAKMLDKLGAAARAAGMGGDASDAENP